jgi:RNA polymerase sigma factor (sigma-70 family)
MTWRMAIDRQRANPRRVEREIQDSAQREIWGARGAGVEAGLQAGRGPSDAVDVVVEQERAEYLWAAIEALPEKLRLTIVLAGIEGYDVREVAALLDVPDGTVKSRLFLARKALKERLSWMAT